MSIKDYMAQVIGVEPSAHTNKNGETKGKVASKAGDHLVAGLKEAGEAAWLGTQDAAEEAKRLVEEYGKEGLEQGKIYGKKALDTTAEYGGAAADYVYDSAAAGAEKTKETALKAAEEARKVAAKKGNEAWVGTKQSAEWAAEKGSEITSEQFQNAKEMTGDAWDATKGYTYEQWKAAQKAVPEYLGDAYELAGNTFHRFEDEAGNVWERVTDAAGTYYQRQVKSASEQGERIADKAGDMYEYYKDASGKEARRLVNKADKQSHQAVDEAHGLFHSAYDKLTSVFSHGKEEAADKAAQLQKEGSKMAQSGRQYAEEAASSIKDYATPQPKHSWLPSFMQSQPKVFDQTKFEKYFKKNSHLNMDEWKAYFKDSNINPAYWIEYMDAYQKGPRGLNAYWKKAEHQTQNARNAIAGQYHHTRNNLQKSLGPNDQGVAPVSLFWTAVLALYLLVLAKRMFEQKRMLVSHEKDGRDTPASSAAEKLRLSDVARASSDSLSNFALYAPATAVVLLTHELQNAASPYVLHGLYAALFVGQILQNEATYVSTPKARGAGIYLSWAAAGLAGAAGITTSLTGFHL